VMLLPGTLWIFSRGSESSPSPSSFQASMLRYFSPVASKAMLVPLRVAGRECPREAGALTPAFSLSRLPLWATSGDALAHGRVAVVKRASEVGARVVGRLVAVLAPGDAVQCW
jgi:hypothetical protein